MTVYDYLVIGSGAGGAAAAYRLAKSGASVLVLERGPRLPRDGSTLDVNAVLRDGAFAARETWHDANGNLLTPNEFANVGGKTKWYGAALLRFSPEEFAADAAHQCPAWPIGYDALRPYYEQAESLLRVRTFEVERDLRAIVDRFCMGGGWREEALPVGLSADILAHPEEAKHFDGFASAAGLKSDGEMLLAAAADAPNLTLIAGKPVVALVPSPADARHVVGAVCADGSTYRAHHVLLAAGALHSPRLLQVYLESTGLAARLPAYAHVGRHYKYHVLTAMLALSPRPVADVLRKTALLLSDEFPHSSVQNTGYVDGDILATQAPALLPRWAANAVGRRVYGFWLTTEDGSHAENRVVAARDGVGTPRLDYDLRRLPPARAEHARLRRAVAQRLLAAGYLPIAKSIPLTGSAHACGTLMAGHEPATSVVDADGRVHGLENVYAVDGSVLTRSSRVNPALTIYAWALRTADRLARGLVH